MEGERFIERIRREETERASEVIDLSDVTPENITKWSDPENFVGRKRKTLHGLELTYSLDNDAVENRQVTFVRMVGPFEEKPHFHADANSFLIFTKGEGGVMQEINGERRTIHRGAGHRAFVPKGVVHGFSLKEGEVLELVSIQTPPIQDSETGEEDYVIVGE